MNRKLNRKVDKSFRAIDKFITEMMNAKENAVEVHDEAQEQIDELESIQEKCNKINKITNKLLDVSEE